MDPAVELEEDQSKRLEEIRFLQNICAALPDEMEQNRMRRAMVVMLYAHFEGFAKLALEVYRRTIDEQGLKCCEVQPALATAALNDLFKAFRNPEQGLGLLPGPIKGFPELRAFAIERAFVEKAWEFGQQVVSIPDKFVDTESNLKPVVLRKNLYRLGLAHDLFDNMDASISKLLNYRHRIAHGGFPGGLDELEYTELSSAVMLIMDELRKTILQAITSEAFRLQSFKSVATLVSEQGPVLA